MVQSLLRVSKNQSRDKNVKQIQLCQCGGQFSVSARLGYSTQLFSHILIRVSLRRYFVYVANIYNQLTLRKEIILDNMGGPHPISYRH